jgi:glyoxylase-like metal-dependent hydrolase (beta-lactamase superfamily II)
MGLNLKVFCTGPLQNNVILITDEFSKESILIDPSLDPEAVARYIVKEGLILKFILFTHGHFDHFAGLSYLSSKIYPGPKTGLHKDDLNLWQDGGGSRQFRVPINIPGDPDFFLDHGQKVMLAGHEIEVRHTPGHSPGSVIFYIQECQTALVGDLIFHLGVGRTDLDGGSFKALKQSILTQVFTLPPDTVLIPGHGPETTVAEEMESNPYLGRYADFDL